MLRRGYYVYFGVASATYYNSISFEFDDSFNGTLASEPMNFSVDGWTKGSTLKNDHSKTHHFYGCFVYFETFPREGTLGITVPSRPDTSISQMIRGYFNDMGMPWGYLILSFIIPIVLIGAVYRFARYFKISLPTFIYTIFIAVGFSASFVIGLLDFWMLAFIVSIAIFTTLFTYREAINVAYETVSGVPLGRRSEVSQEVKALKGIGRRSRLPDAGVRGDTLKSRKAVKMLKEYDGSVSIMRTDTGSAIYLEDKYAKGFHARTKNGKTRLTGTQEK
jgi:hypothetical protein